MTNPIDKNESKPTLSTESPQPYSYQNNTPNPQNTKTKNWTS